MDPLKLLVWFPADDPAEGYRGDELMGFIPNDPGIVGFVLDNPVMPEFIPEVDNPDIPVFILDTPVYPDIPEPIPVLPEFIPAIPWEGVDKLIGEPKLEVPGCEKEEVATDWEGREGAEYEGPDAMGFFVGVDFKKRKSELRIQS